MSGEVKKGGIYVNKMRGYEVKVLSVEGKGQGAMVEYQRLERPWPVIRRNQLVRFKKAHYC